MLVSGAKTRTASLGSTPRRPSATTAPVQKHLAKGGAASQQLVLGVGQRRDPVSGRLLGRDRHGLALRALEIDHPPGTVTPRPALDREDAVLPVDAQQLLEQRRVAARLGD